MLLYAYDYGLRARPMYVHARSWFDHIVSRILDRRREAPSPAARLTGGAQSFHMAGPCLARCYRVCGVHAARMRAPVIRAGPIRDKCLHQESDLLVSSIGSDTVVVSSDHHISFASRAACDVIHHCNTRAA